MNKKYEVKYKKFEFVSTEEEVSNNQIQKISDSQYLILYKNKSIKAYVHEIHTKEGIVILRIAGKLFSYSVSNPTQTLIQKLGFNKKTGNLDKIVKAPMPGIVLSVEVKPNDKISKGQNLLKLEAMKMENIIKSPADGIIKKINVKLSDKVDKNQILIELE